MNQIVLVLDFGGQYKNLIARRVRECSVYSIVKPGNISAAEARQLNPIGIILSGGPASVFETGAPTCAPEIFNMGVPVLGICYGQQLMCSLLGGEVQSGQRGEFGEFSINLDTRCPLFAGLEPEQTVLMSHTDIVVRLPDGFSVAASTENCPYAAVYDPARRFYGIQFHAETKSTKNGQRMLHSFLYNVCGAKGDYRMGDFIKRETQALREQIGDRRVLLGLSGGVDSSVCAALLSRAIGERLTCIFVDHGLMRENEGDEVEAAFSAMPLNFIRVNAGERFLTALKGVTDPEQKRKIIGREFVNVFADEAARLGRIELLAQGTIYPDVIESGADGAAVIKSHHNVGGLPADIGFDGVVEPLSRLFKDEVRTLGRRLGLPAVLTGRQPFPGPGLGIRVIGEVTEEKLAILRRADAIFREEVERGRRRPHQYFAVLTDLRSVGVMGDGRTYDRAIALRAVDTEDFMTCTRTRLSNDVLDRAAARIVNETPGVNRVLYDITSKPPATVEYE